MAPMIDELAVADAPAAWRAIGFEVDGDTSVVGDVRVRLVGVDAGRGLIGWSLRGVERENLDGLPTTPSESQPSIERRSANPSPPAIAWTR